MQIKRYRLESGMSQSALAKKLDVDQTAVSQWEKGDTKPRADKLLLLADALNVTVDELLGRSAEERKAQ